MKKVYCFAAFALLFISVHAQNISKKILVDDVQRTYILHLPPAFSTAQKLPLIVALHGGGGTAQRASDLYNLEPLADKNNFIIVYPDAIDKAWHIPGMATRVKNADTAVDDVHFISVLLDTLIKNYKSDDKKIFCTGLSRGAMFSYYLADVLNERIAAIAPVCGSISKTMASTWSFKKSIPVLIINGTADPLVNYYGGYGKLNKRNENNENADLLPTEDLVQKIVSFNHCNTKPVITVMPNINKADGCTATEYVYDGGNAKVDFISIQNGGHAWPGGSQYLPKFLVGEVCKDFSASQKIFDFFMHN